MPWMPGVIRKEVARHRTRMTARRFVFHTAVSGASSLFAFFNQPGNPTSHFYVRADATVEQYVNTDYQAPAQLEGNHDCVSVETQDMGDGFPVWSGSNVPAWSAAQVATLARVSAWVASTHQIPLLMLPDSRNGLTGYGYHRLGVDPWRVSGGELWSNSYGKVCPGDRRIAQIPTILALAQGDDMPLTDDDAKKVAAEVWAHLVANAAGDRFEAQTFLRKASQADSDVWAYLIKNTAGDLYAAETFLRKASQADSDVWAHLIANSAGDLFEAQTFLRQASEVTIDVPALAAAIVALLPSPTELTQAEIQEATEAGLRKVLGGLDKPSS